MPAFGEGSPFGQIQPTDLSAMLQAVFNPAPMPDQMQFQAGRPAENQFIDLGAGGPPPGTPRGNFLSGLGDMAQAVAPMVGGAMSANSAANAKLAADAASAMGNSPGTMTVGGTAAPNAFGRTGGFVVNLPALPTSPARR